MATMGVELEVLLSVCFSSIGIARAPLSHFSDFGFQITLLILKSAIHYPQSAIPNVPPALCLLSTL